ncbi:Rap/ranGAP protein, putative [Acanthamoeba castellanii str. Neff]|uniref:Rap/ranGAP protein, putative n=1 Tax=Acanthamoeba castellanii (strain ATCC 30010 / Neff) TaxID=1257118 RepID=L8GZ88_ACACF|nr:Rap/ranGAP protein, putative [Acanthamoeba castellanii str. Neff]ELR17421.1 Rap/ranGAP protein, putative [Acanthamoeba castellanii str. Neff]
MLASSSSGSHTPPPTRAGGVLKRLRQILWEGVGRDAPVVEESSAPPRAEPAASTATTPQPPHTAAGTSRPAPTRQSTNTAAVGVVGPPTLHHEHLLKEALKRMSKHSPLQTRLALVNEVCEYSRSYSIDDVLTVWGTVKDLVGEDQPSYVRKLGYEIMHALIDGQYDRLGSLRMEFFAVIQRNKHNFVARLKNLVALTKNGHNIAPFENDICQLLLTWLERGKGAYSHEIIAFAAKVVKYNPYALPEAPKTAFICHVCAICNTSTEVKLVESCLNFFDILVRYSHIPEQSLVEFINALCRTLNIEACCQRSWQLMTNVLKSPCGHQGVIALCATLDNPDNVHVVNLLRGAVFYLSMASWGSYRISTLHVTRSAVLPYLLRVEWDVILRIIRNLLPYLVGHEDNEQYSLIPVVREILEVIHELHKNFQFMGPTEALIELLEDFSAYCRHDTVTHLITEKQVLREHRAPIQVKALSVLEHIFTDFHVLYGDEIISVILPVFDAIYASGTVALTRSVYRRGLDFLVHAASVTKSNKFFAVADVMEKASRCKKDGLRYDAIAGLIRLFVKKFTQKRHAHTLHLLDVMLKLAKERHPTLRAKVIVFLLSFRASSRYLMQLSLHRYVKPEQQQQPDDNTTNTKDAAAAIAGGGGESLSSGKSGTTGEPKRKKGFTSPLTSPRGKKEAAVKDNEENSVAGTSAKDPAAANRPSSPPPHDPRKKESVGLLAVGPLLDTLISALQIEPVYEIFVVVARGLMEMLKNYYILRAADVCSLASVLCKLLRSGTFGACVDPTVRKDSAVRGRLLEMGYELLIMLVGYQSQLKPKYREYLISCLCEGLTSNLSSIPPHSALAVQRICINGLSIGLSEVPESMTQRISAIVGDMHKVCERNLGPKRHLQMPEKSELARHVLEFFSFLLDAPSILSALKDDDRQRLFLTLMLLTDQTEFAPHVSNHAYIVWADFFMASPVHLRLGYYRMGANYLVQRLVMDNTQASGAAKVSAGDSNYLLMATLDLFAQSVFGNCDNTPLPPPEDSFLFENAQVRNWAQGNCIIKMRVGKMGWVEVVVRRPAGSQRWIMQIQNVIHQVAAPVNTLKVDEQLKKCIEEAPWMFTHLQAGDSLLHDRQTKLIPERTVSDIGARGRPLLHREASRAVLTESRELQMRPREEAPPVVMLAKRSRSAPLLRRGSSARLDEADDTTTAGDSSSIGNLPPTTTGASAATTGQTDPMLGLMLDIGHAMGSAELDSPNSARADAEAEPAKPASRESSFAAEERPKRDRSVSEKITASGAVKEGAQARADAAAGFTARQHSIPCTAQPSTAENEEKGEEEVPPASPPRASADAPTGEAHGVASGSSSSGEIVTSPPRKWTDPSTDEVHAAPAAPATTPITATTAAAAAVEGQGAGAEVPTTPLLAVDPARRGEPRGKEKIEHWRKKFISKVGPHHGVRVVLPPHADEGVEPDGADIPRRRSFSEIAHEDANANLHKAPTPLSASCAKRMHRRHASTVEFSLSVFYPPLPSYEGSEEEKSPPLFVPPRHGGDALLWKRGRCVSYEHVDLTNQKLSIEGQMLLHAVSSSPKSLEEPALLMRASPPTANDPDHSAEASATDHPPVIGDIEKEDLGGAQAPAAPKAAPDAGLLALPAPTAAAGMLHHQPLAVPPPPPPSLTRVVSLELDAYTPPAAGQQPEDDLTGLSLVQEVRTLLPPEFDISPSSSLDSSSAPTTPQRSSVVAAASPMTEPVSPPSLPPAAASSSMTIVTDHHHGSEPTGGSTASTPNASRATTDAQQQPTSTSERQPSSSTEVEAVELLQDSGETAVTAHKSPPAAEAAEPKAEVVGAASSVAGTSDHHKGGLAVDDQHHHHKQLKEPKNKGGSIRKEKDELMLLGNGLISPSSSGMMLRAREPDEKEADEADARAPELERGSPSPSFFMPPRPPAERHTGAGGDFTPPRPTSTGDEPPSGARKERRTSLLHNLFSGYAKPFKIPSTLFDIHPSFVFSQMKNIPFIEDSPPKELKSGDEALTRALSILDRTPTTVCAKVGIIYVGEHQETEEQILGNTAGSPRYFSLLNRLGDKIRLKDTAMYAGGLDTREDSDGHYTIHWRSVSTQVVYHVVTMIPNQLHLYRNYQNKKRHIGNDNVNIVYSDSPKEFKQDTIQGQFNFVHIVVHPLKEGFYRVEVKKKPQVPSFGPITSVQIVSERAMPTLVRQVALSANLAACLVQDPHLQRYSNLEERLRQLRKVAERFAKPE